MEFGKVEYVCTERKRGGRPESRALLLTLIGQGDEAELRKMGIRALRLRRIVRLTNEAYEQGRLLGYEDLSNLLMTSLSTLKRDVAHLQSQGMKVLIRGRRNGKKNQDTDPSRQAGEEGGA